MSVIIEDDLGKLIANDSTSLPQITAKGSAVKPNGHVRGDARTDALVTPDVIEIAMKPQLWRLHSDSRSQRPFI